MPPADGGGPAPRRRPGRAWVALALACLALAAAACGGVSERDWRTAVDGAGRVASLIRAGDYGEARSVWREVDPVIHKVYPRLAERDPELAGRLWHEMAVVELGFLRGSWDEAAAAAEALPALLTAARRELAGGGG